MSENGTLSVLSEGYDKVFGGRIRSANGQVWVVDQER